MNMKMNNITPGMILYEVYLFLFILQQSLCSEMAEELRFAIKCHGSSQKPKNKRKKVCSNCRSYPHKSDCPLKAMRSESLNGTVHKKDYAKPLDNGQRSGDFELDYIHGKCEFGAGGYLHVEYSDTES